MRRVSRSANPARGFHEQDRNSFVALFQRVCGCSLKGAEALERAYPRGQGAQHATKAAFQSLGLTAKQADRVEASFALARQVACHGSRTTPTIQTPEDATAFLATYAGDLEQESFLVVLLDSRQKVIDVLEVAVGTLAQVDVHPREVFKEAIRLRAHSVLLAHNHPSGDVAPSTSDIDLTQRLLDVGRLLAIPVIDHVIVSKADGRPISLSLRAAGVIEDWDELMRG